MKSRDGKTQGREEKKKKTKKRKSKKKEDAGARKIEKSRLTAFFQWVATFLPFRAPASSFF